jgi:hypothetical protein
MKYYSRLRQYKASNLTFNPETGEGRSYEWYSIARKFDGVLVLNAYAYSKTTARHATKLRGLFRSLGLEWVEIEAPQGLQCLDDARKLVILQIQNLNAEINKPRSRPQKNAERFARIAGLKEKLGLIDKLQQKVA